MFWLAQLLKLLVNVNWTFLSHGNSGFDITEHPVSLKHMWIVNAVLSRKAFFVCSAELSQPIPLPTPEPQRCDTDPPQRRKRLDLCVMTFAERLQQYFRTRVCLSAEEVSVAQQRALDISTEIQAFLHSKHPDMPLGDMMLAGSLLDDLQVVKADHACLIVPLQVSRFSLDHYLFI